MRPEEELVDIVDEKDHVVGQATRAEVRKRGLRHRAAYVLVFNSLGQLFVHRRTSTKDVYPSWFDVAVGGVVQAGETYEDSAVREIAEELGIERVGLRRVVSLRFEDGTNRVNGMVFSCTWDGPLRLQDTEIESGEWVDLDVVAERTREEAFCPDGLEALCRYLDRLEHARMS